MRALLALLALGTMTVASCGSREEVPASGAAAATFKAEQAAGTWIGTTYAVAGDSALATWVSTQQPDGSGKLAVTLPVPDTIAFTSTFDADSMMGTSEPYKDRTLPAGSPRVIWKSVGRMTADGKLAGTTSLRPADKPDSVIQTMRWEAARKP